MRNVSPSRLASTACVVITLLAFAVAVPFVLRNLDLADSLGRTDDFVPILTIIPLALVSSAVGVIIVFRIPANVVGWLFLIAAVAFAIGTLANNVAIDAVNGPTPAAEGWKYIANLPSVLFVVGLYLVVVALLLFPNGRVLSKKWRWVIGLMPVSLVVSLVSNHLTVEEPLLEGHTSFFKEPPLNDLALGILEAASAAAALAFIVAAAMSLVLRYRRGDAEQREQLKWIALAATLLTFVITIDILAPPHPLINVADGLAFTAIPVAAGVAITKYRLYDIDILISRTLVYGPMTAILAGTYTAAIVFFRLVFVDVLDFDSDAAVATTTLAIAALFMPLKNRVQSVVDRFFKEDERKRLDAFRREMGKTADMLDMRALATRFAEHVSAATGGPVRIVLNDTNGTITHPQGSTQDTVATVVPLNSGGQTIGRVEVSPPTRGILRPAQLTAIEQASTELARIASLRQT